ncbi:MAG: O-antigen ligase [Paludibacter sp.]|nr:O-antigen ligase [Paludibacter sp.]MDD4426889.1 O-antigen ligase [Paludibacter sp.]
MKLLITNIVFAISALILVLYAPEYYSYSFCYLLAGLFVFQNLIYFIFRRDHNIVGFEFIFMIAFWFTNFVYPLFYFQTDPTFSIFAMAFNQNIISKATAIAYLGYSSYLVGISFFELRKYEYNAFKVNDKLEPTSRKVFYITIIFFVLYLISGGVKNLSEVYRGDGSLDQQGISSYFYMLFFSSSILLTMFIFNESILIKYRLKYILLITVIFLLFMGLGSRTLPLAIGLTALVSFNNYKYRIPFLTFFLLIIIGAMLMTFVVFARTISFNEENYFQNAIANVQIASFWDFGSDLIINNRNLYTLIDFADSFGQTYGLTMLGGLLSPVPFFQGFVCNTFGIPPDFISSATFNTFLEMGTDSSWGLGSNLVADVYLAFGIVGVIFMFFMLGLLIGKSKLASSYNIYWNIFYFFMASNSIYLLRSGFFDNLRYIIWALLTVYFLNIRLKRSEDSNPEPLIINEQ